MHTPVSAGRTAPSATSSARRCGPASPCVRSGCCSALGAVLVCCWAARCRSTRSGSTARMSRRSGTNGAQPDWYLGLADRRAADDAQLGAPDAGYTIPQPVLRRRRVPALDVRRCSSHWPWIERFARPGIAPSTTCSTARTTRRGARPLERHSSPGWFWCRSSTAPPTACSSGWTSRTRGRSGAPALWLLLPAVVFGITLHWMRGARRRGLARAQEAFLGLAGALVAAHELRPGGPRHTGGVGSLVDSCSLPWVTTRTCHPSPAGSTRSSAPSWRKAACTSSTELARSIPLASAIPSACPARAVPKPHRLMRLSATADPSGVGIEWLRERLQHLQTLVGRTGGGAHRAAGDRGHAKPWPGCVPGRPGGDRDARRARRPSSGSSPRSATRPGSRTTGRSSPTPTSIRCRRRCAGRSR